MEVERTPGGALLINDAYNANPASTEAALRALTHTAATRRIAVLGPMLELGDLSDGEHRRIGDLARSLGIEVIAVDAPAYGGDDVAGVDEVVARLAGVGTDAAVLVKASRAVGLERVAARLLGTGDAGW
jgi:UDP-N-acetylmuramoyl-tripeptide--D-alanyl-D-alanine ligase